MYLDFAVALILIICIFRGDKKGFLLSFISAAGWLIAVLGAFIGKNYFLTILDEKTDVRANITAKVTEYFQTKLLSDATGASSDGTIPGSVSTIMRNAAEKAVEASAEAAATPVVDAIMAMLAFIILAILIKIAIFIVQFVLNSFIESVGVLGSMDSIAGMIVGVIKGMVLSYVILIFLCAIATMGTMTVLIEQLSGSIIIEALDHVGLLPFSAEILTEL